VARDAAGGMGGTRKSEFRWLADHRSRRTTSLGSRRSSLRIPNVKAAHLELKRLRVVLANAVHHRLVLPDDLATRVAGLTARRTAEDLRAVVAGKNPAYELLPYERAQRLLGHDVDLARPNAGA